MEVEFPFDCELFLRLVGVIATFLSDRGVSLLLHKVAKGDDGLSSVWVYDVPISHTNSPFDSLFIILFFRPCDAQPVRDGQWLVGNAV